MKAKPLARTTLRGAQLILHLALASLFITMLRVRKGKHWHLTVRGQSFIRWWMQHATRIVGIRIIQYGRPYAGNALFVSNHISFLDILAISSAVPVRFLSKHSIRYWPIIGYLTALSGSLFIKRGKRNQLNRVLVVLKHALTSPRSVLIFPEGTTSLGKDVLKFHSGLFQAAIDNQVPVQPLSLHYRRGQQPDRLAAYIDKDNLLVTLLRLMARPHTQVHLSFTSPVDCHGHTRQSLAAYCHARISHDLQNLLHTLDKPSAFDAPAEFAILGECE